MNTMIAVKYQFVLLVDDNPMENMVHEKMMDTSGFTNKVHALESGRQTLEYISGLPLDELPQIIFLDIIMPGMDGFQFLEEYDKLDPEIHKRCKIVLLSTSDSFKDLNRANKNRHVRKFLNKPLTAEMLKAINL